MKKRKKNVKENNEHRGNNSDLVKLYQQEINVVHRVPKTYYTSEGELVSVDSLIEK